MSDDLVVVGRDRTRALAELTRAAEQAATTHEAAEVMHKAKAVASVLEQIRAPFAETRQAGVASVVAARRLGRLLSQLSPKATLVAGSYPPSWEKSDRRRAVEDVGIGRGQVPYLIRLAEMPDPDFQRYLQRSDVIPSMHGALGTSTVFGRNADNRRGKQRRKVWQKLGIKSPSEPSIDEAHSLVIRALGHVDNPTRGGSNTKKADLAEATRLLYAAEDLLRKYVGGYVR